MPNLGEPHLPSAQGAGPLGDVDRNRSPQVPEYRRCDVSHGRPSCEVGPGAERLRPPWNWTEQFALVSCLQSAESAASASSACSHAQRRGADGPAATSPRPRLDLAGVAMTGSSSFPAFVQLSKWWIQCRQGAGRMCTRHRFWSWCSGAERCPAKKWPADS